MKRALLVVVLLLGWRMAVGERFVFKEGPMRAYEIQVSSGIRLMSVPGDVGELEARPVGGGASIRVGRRLAVQVAGVADPGSVVDGWPLDGVREVAPGFWILEAPDVATAVHACAALSKVAGVVVAHPIARRPFRKAFGYGPAPADPYFSRQWNFENRNASDGRRAGVDLNLRSAWAWTRGEGVLVAVGDDGVDMGHRDLADALEGGPHWNFETGQTNGNHGTTTQAHGTAVAGLVGARGGNGLGMAGAAPGARLASWVIFGRADDLVDDAAMMDMFQYRSNVVSVQNHSWANTGPEQLGPTPLQWVGISNAAVRGRGGLGVVMVRAGGNGRDNGVNANDDGYNADPQAIAVAAVRSDGHHASYSTAGANLLVAAPSGDAADGFPTLFTTDRRGALGFNQSVTTNDLADYGFDTTGFSGTSGSAPQIAGLSALILGANPGLGYRDVQQILVLSARQTDLSDPDLATNSAGLLVSHNVGFGVPDGGVAVRLARGWVPRPARVMAEHRTAAGFSLAIPEDGLLVETQGSTNLDGAIRLIPMSPGTGIHPVGVGPWLEVVDVGSAASVPALDLHGKAALIQRGGNFFYEKINNVVRAGAVLALISNNKDGDARILMGGTDDTMIPALFMSQNAGASLRQALVSADGAGVRVRVNPKVATVMLPVSETLICEHVTVILDTDHTQRGDLHVALISPGGTRSLLQRLNSDTAAGPSGWVYMTTHHFLEGSAGNWTVEVIDEAAGNSGSLLSVVLRVYGVPIEDADHDGLDDRWEMAHFGSLAMGAADDPDGDGVSNAREQLMGTDPTRVDVPFVAELTRWNTNVVRLSWPGLPGKTYQVFAADAATGPWTVQTNLSAVIPETEWMTSSSSLSRRYFRVQMQSGR